MEAILLYAAGAILPLFNLWATILVSRTKFRVKGRRKWQLIFIWCVPLFGAVLAIYLATEPKKVPINQGDNPPLRSEVLWGVGSYGSSGSSFTDDGSGDSGDGGSV